MEIDFGRTAQDYGRYRKGFPSALFDRLAAFGIGAPGQRALDLGTGTGTLARGLALRGCDVTGLDRSPELLEEARRLDREAGVTVRYVTATAEDTGLPDGAFDVVTAGQCWYWFDRERAAREARRVLVAGGRLVIAHFDWIALPGNVAEATEALVRAQGSGWPPEELPEDTGGLYPRWLRDVAVAGLRDIETFSFDVTVLYSHEAWRGRIRASAGVGARLLAEQVARFDAELKRLLEERFAREPLDVPHRVFAVVSRAP